MCVTMGGLTGDPGDAVVQVSELEPVEIPVLTPAVHQRGLVLELDCLLCRGAVTRGNNQLFKFYLNCCLNIKVTTEFHILVSWLVPVP